MPIPIVESGNVILQTKLPSVGYLVFLSSVGRRFYCMLVNPAETRFASVAESCEPLQFCANVYAIGPLEKFYWSGHDASV